MRGGRLAAVAVAITLFSCSQRAPRTSPFELWTLRPGDSLATVSERIRRLAGRELTCGPLVGPSRICATRSPGSPLTAAPGTLHFVVDSSNIVTLVQFRRQDYSPPAVREQMASEWNTEVRALSAKYDSLKNVSSAGKVLPSYRMQRWTTSDSGWSADVRYDSREATAQMVTLSNETALNALRQYSPLAGYVLSQHGIIGELTDVPEILLAALASREAPAMTLGSPAPIDIPECALELADVVLPARPGSFESSDARSQFGQQSSGVAEAAVPVAYPGWRLAFGQHVYLVSPAGVAEKVNLRIQRDYHSAGVREGEDIYAIAIQRPRRAEAARRRLEALDPALQCSSRGDVIFIRQAADGTIAESVKIPIDEEAPLTEISRIEFVPTLEGRGSLVVGYVAGYATDSWSGDVEWRARIATDPPRVIGRTPVSFQTVGKEPGDSGKGIMLTRLTAETLAVHTLEEHGSSVSTRSARIPLGAGKVLSGARLLEQLH